MNLVKKRYLISLFFVFLLIVFSNIVVASNISVTLEKTGSGNIDSKLYELINSSDRIEYAEKNDIKYRDGRAEVVLELKQNTEIPKGYNITINQRYIDNKQNLIQAYISVDNLTDISQEKNITYIRLPYRSSPTNMENHTNTDNPENPNSTENQQNRTQNSILFGGILPVLTILLFILLINKQ